MRQLRSRLGISMATSAIGAAVAAAALGAAPAAAKTIEVFPGGSIQAAVDLANPGDVIAVHRGVYHGSVRIHKDNLTLRGAGATSQGTVLKAAPSKKCGKPRGAVGICVLHHTDEQGHPVLTRGTEVSGFQIEGFRFLGAFVGEAEHTVFRRNAFVDDGLTGAAAGREHGRFSRGTQFISNRATGNAAAGFSITGTPRAGALVKGNVSAGNGTGIYVADSVDGVIRNNVARRNCVGIEVLDTGAPGAAAHGWTIENNRAPKNNRKPRLCKTMRPGLFGAGIALLGASHNDVNHNRVSGNRGNKKSGFPPGGIVLADSDGFEGGPASHNTIAHNKALRNKPADIVWDGHGAGNTFPDNDCGTSRPRRICH
jgi:parallel beta-helix repeat protein